MINATGEAHADIERTTGVWRLEQGVTHRPAKRVGAILQGLTFMQTRGGQHYREGVGGEGYAAIAAIGEGEPEGRSDAEQKQNKYIEPDTAHSVEDCTLQSADGR